MKSADDNSRRQFLRASAKAGLAMGLGLGAADRLLAAGSGISASGRPSGSREPVEVSPSLLPFDQAPLPYAFNALEPALDAPTLELHYTKHAAAYSKNLKEAAMAENIGPAATLEEVLADISRYSAKLRNNAGGHYNHELFWKCMKHGSTGQPAGKLADAIRRDFHSFESFQSQFSESAKTRFGSGWAWLIADSGKKLRIVSTPNQDNPLMDIAEQKGMPLLGLDVWEHAYYLKYQYRRADYIGNWWKVVNWDFVQQRFENLP